MTASRMITADELLARPVELLDHIAKIAPRRTAADKREADKKAEEMAILKRIADMPAGTHVLMTEIGESRPAKDAKRRAREAGLIKRTQAGLSQVWRRTSKEWRE